MSSSLLREPLTRTELRLAFGISLVGLAVVLDLDDDCEPTRNRD